MALASDAMKSDVLNRASKFYWYHCVDLGNGIVTDGDYDMREYWDAYRFPDIRGKSVLDVGRASGFFAFEFERLGADVTATEIASYLDWDFVGGEEERARKAALIGDPKGFTEHSITGAFNFAHSLKNSKVTPRTTTIYNISSESVGGPFDVVFAGSVTSHLRDPILGLEKLRAVTKEDGFCIVSAPCIGINQDLPIAAMVGTADTDHRSWWVVNEKCLVEMLKCAGFKTSEIVGEVTISMRRKVGNDIPTKFPHIIAHARP